VILETALDYFHWLDLADASRHLAFDGGVVVLDDNTRVGEAFLANEHT
jgi:hypothetical protein